MIGVDARRTRPVSRALSAAPGLFRTCGLIVLGLLLLPFLVDRSAPWLPRLLVMLMIPAAARLPVNSLPVLAALVPFGGILAPIPFRASEALAMAWLFGLLLPVRRLEAVGKPRLDGRVLAPAWCFVAVVLTSLAVRLSIRDVGLAPWPLAISVIQSLGMRYLVTAGADQTVAAAVLPIEGVLLFAAMVIAAQHDRRLPGRVVATLAAAGVIAAVLTVGDTVYQFARARDPYLITRFFAGERFSILASDVNAAGSLLALGGAMLACYAAWADRRARWATVGLLLMLPALWLTGSRAAVLSLALTGAAAAWWRVRMTRNGGAMVPRRVMLAAAVLLAGAVLYFAWTILQVNTPGSAGRALGFRSQFTQTSVRMFLTAPWFGVGVGQYYGLSGLYMPESLREIYGLENAHNYFMQVATELGVLGVVAFAWLLAWPLRDGWRGLVRQPWNRVQLAALAGAVAYLVTCTTGHPLLVPDMALPFWIVLAVAVLAARRPDVGCDEVDASARRTSPALRRTPAMITGLLLLVLVVSFPFRASAVMNTATTAPVDMGFREPGVMPDGRPFRWIAPIATFHVPSGPGLLEIPLRAPGIWTEVPFEMDVFVSGWFAQRVTLAPNQWRTVTLTFRESAPFHFRKITLRANQAWIPGRAYQRHDDRPVSVFAGDYTFTPRPRM